MTGIRLHRALEYLCICSLDAPDENMRHPADTPDRISWWLTWHLLRQYLSEMQAMGLPANSDIYMAVMNGMGERGSWREAEALFQEMQGLDMPIHEIIHAALLAAYGCAFNNF